MCVYDFVGVCVVVLVVVVVIVVVLGVVVKFTKLRMGSTIMP